MADSEARRRWSQVEAARPVSAARSAPDRTLACGALHAQIPASGASPLRYHIVALVLTLPVLAADADAQEQFLASHHSGLLSSYPVSGQQPEMPVCCAAYFWGRSAADRGSLFVEQNTFQATNFQAAPPQARAEYKVFDVVFGAPAGVTSTTVYVYATLGGDYTGSVTGPTSCWTADHFVGFTLDFGGNLSGFAARGNNCPGVWPPQSTGLLAGYSMDDSYDIVAGPFNVPTNTPLIFSMVVQASVNSVLGGGASTWAKLTLGQGSGDLGGSYEVFGLDPGITANSVSAGIVDNQFSPATEVGFRFCQPLAPNSSGVDAVIAAMGSDEVAANNLTLVVSGLPLAGTTAMLINSMNAWAGVNNPASGGVASDGRICIGGGTFGRHGQHIYSGTAGTFSAPLDLTALPHSALAGTYSVPVLAGQTWYWQCWYRDQSLGAGRSNFSAALGIHFE